MFLLFFPLRQSPPSAARTMGGDGALGPGSPLPLPHSLQSFLKSIGQTPLQIVTIFLVSLLHHVALISYKSDPEGGGSCSLLGIEGSSCPGCPFGVCVITHPC